MADPVPDAVVLKILSITRARTPIERLYRLNITRWNIHWKAVRMFESGRRLVGVGIVDVVRASVSEAARYAIQPGGPAHPIGHHMVRAGRIAGEAQPSNHLSIGVKGNPAAGGHDASDDMADACSFL